MELPRFPWGPPTDVASVNVARAARENTAGGTKWLASWSSSAGSALWRSFMSPIASCVASTRSTGSSMFVYSGALISMILFP